MGWQMIMYCIREDSKPVVEEEEDNENNNEKCAKLEAGS